MQTFMLAAKNYRCFTDEHPLRLEIGDGFTALIGPNNSGKSSALRMIWELRHVWETLFSNLHGWIQNPENGIGFGNIKDADDIFTNLNNRDIEIELVFPDAPQDGFQFLSKLTIRFPRSRLGRAIVSIYATHGASEKELRKQVGAGISERGISVQGIGEVDTFSCRDALGALLNSIYIGAFRNAINQGAGQYYDIQVGTGFVALWNAWKVGSTKANMDKTLSVTKTIQELFGFDNLEINAHANDQNLVVVVNDRSYLLSELGSGLAQFIIVLGNVAIRSPALILVDEPELNLHPSLQQKFLLQLAYASQGTVFATHSLGLARSTSANIYSFQSHAGVSRVHRFEATPSFGELMGELGYSSYRELGYDRVLLVEGVTDAPVYREFLRKLNVDHKVLVIPLGGNQLARGDVEHELHELKRLSERVFALVDSEKPSEAEPACGQRLAFQGACNAVGIPVLLTERRATENYLSDRAIKNVFGQGQREFLPYESRKDVGPCWKKGDNWKVAAAMTLDELIATDIGQFLQQQVVGS